MQKLKLQVFISHLPSIYILPKSDKLVPKSKAIEFQKCFESLLVKKIDGPHFILQANAKKSSDIILNFFKDFDNPT